VAHRSNALPSIATPTARSVRPNLLGRQLRDGLYQRRRTLHAAGPLPRRTATLGTCVQSRSRSGVCLATPPSGPSLIHSWPTLLTLCRKLRPRPRAHQCGQACSGVNCATGCTGHHLLHSSQGPCRTATLGTYLQSPPCSGACLLRRYRAVPRSQGPCRTATLGTYLQSPPRSGACLLRRCRAVSRLCTRGPPFNTPIDCHSDPALTSAANIAPERSAHETAPAPAYVSCILLPRRSATTLSHQYRASTRGI
jgi:hypothetical protein